MTKAGKIIIISGPTGSGETVITKKILTIFPKAERIITATTRPPRPQEKPDVDYLFLSPKKFNKMIKNGEILEYIKIPNRDVYYGTLKKPIEQKLTAGINLICNLGWPGGKSFKTLFPGRVLSIFIKPDNLAIIKNRLIRRDPTISQTEIKKRLVNAAQEMKEAKYYDFIVINREHKIKQAITEIKKIMTAFIAKP